MFAVENNKLATNAAPVTILSTGMRWATLATMYLSMTVLVTSPLTQDSKADRY